MVKPRCRRPHKYGSSQTEFYRLVGLQSRGSPKVRTQPIYRFSTKVELIYPHERRGDC